MTSNAKQTQNNAGVSLTLQNLIDQRMVTPDAAQSNVLGLSTLAGQTGSQRRGHGLEFEDLRSYAVGDDTRHIDWKVSARHNKLHTRIFREDKEQLVTLALDFTSPMFTGSHELKAVQAGRMTANLAWQIVSTGGRCGLLIQTDTGFHAVRPALGDKSALAICAEIATHFELAKRAVTALSTGIDDQTQNNITLLERLLMNEPGGGTTILLAGLQKADNAFAKKLNELQVAKQLIVLSIEDPIEYEALPSGLFRYKTRGTSTSVALRAQQTAELKRILEQQHQQLIAAFAQAQVPLLHSRDGIFNIKATLKALGFLA